VSDAAVVDASVALKWVIDEALSGEARALLDGALAGDHFLFAPPLILSEVLNAIYQNERRERISTQEADRALVEFLQAPVEFVAPDRLHPHAMNLARHYGLRATYDAQYLALALLLDAEFWTADERLFTALSPSLPWVRLLAHYQVSGT